MTEAPAAVRLPEPVWQRALDVLHGADEVGLLCHVSPDADALGSMLALGIALRSLGKRVACSWGDPVVVVPRAYGFLPGRELVTSRAEFPDRPGVVVTLDTSSRDRLGAYAPLTTTACEVVVIDHHPVGDGFGTVRVVDEAAAATALLVEELVRRLGVPLTPDIAACVYAGLSTDTGSFRYAATTPAVHAVAARLLSTGIPHHRIAQALWDTNRFGYLQLLGEVLGRARLEPGAVGGRGLVWTFVTADDLVRHRLELDEVEGFVSVLRTTEEAEVAVVLKEGPDGSLRVSTRSRGTVDVGTVCAALGGGGHRLAAGFTSAVDAATTVQRLRERLEEAPEVGR